MTKERKAGDYNKRMSTMKYAVLGLKFYKKVTNATPLCNEKQLWGFVRISLFWSMVSNATFNIILVISWRSILLEEEIGVPGENHGPVASECKLYHIMLGRVHLAWAGFELTTLVVIEPVIIIRECIPWNIQWWI